MNGPSWVACAGNGRNHSPLKYAALAMTMDVVSPRPSALTTSLISPFVLFDAHPLICRAAPAASEKSTVSTLAPYALRAAPLYESCSVNPSSIQSAFASAVTAGETTRPARADAARLASLHRASGRG